jgi:hypothetical protein
MENDPTNPRVRNNDLLKIGNEIRKEISEKHERVRERALTHTYQLVTAIGIIAGFGFTAIDSMQNIAMFLIGESLLFAGMAVGIWFAKAGFIDEIKYLTGWANKLDSIRKKRIDMEKKFAENNIAGLQKEMEGVDNETGNIFNNETRLANYNWLTAIFILFVLGCTFLLFSFVACYKL